MENIAFLPIGPEIVLLGGAVAVLLVEVTMGRSRVRPGLVAGVALGIAFLLSWLQWLRIDEVGPQLNFSARGVQSLRLPMVVMDHFSAFAGLVIFAVSALALAGAWSFTVSLGTRGAEFVALVLLAVAGMHTMAIASNLVLLFIGLETASISLYVVAGLTREQPNSDEAAMKYFLLGSFASAVFLYGVALLFAAFGSTSLYGSGGIVDRWSEVGVELLVSPGIMLAGVAFVVVGLGFKVSAAPFHQWAPDVYQGAPGGAVGFMASGVKIAGFAAIGRILVGGFDPELTRDWAGALAVIAALSILVGTASAIAQTDLKRMLAYSGVAHAGFMLTGLVAGEAGVPAMWFYLSTYAVQLVGAFTVASVVGGERAGASAIDDYTGLSGTRPMLAAAMALFMLALGGIPFTAGFVGKVTVFSAAVSDYLWLVVLGLIAAVAGLFFYLRVIVVMYFRTPAPAMGPGTAGPVAPAVPVSGSIVVAVAAAITLVLGLIPWPLLNLVRSALPL